MIDMFGYMVDVGGFFVTYQSEVVAFLATVVGFYLVRVIVVARLKTLAKRTKNDYDDLVIALVQGIGWLFALTLGLIIALAISPLNLSDIVWLKVVFIVVVTWQVAHESKIFLSFGIRKAKSRVKGHDAILAGLKTLVYGLIWIIGALVVLSTLGIDITSLVAGLGIGGLAVALALQNVFTDLFAAFVIYFDKPFRVGDYVMTTQFDGTVERVGLKSTRLRSPRGEEVVISNKDITALPVQNFGKLKRRRVLVNLSVEYSTPNKKLADIPAGIESVFGKINGADFDRIHLKELGDSALVHELIYFVDSASYDDYVKAQHAVNLALKVWFESQKIGLAYPTQTVQLVK